MLIQGSGPLSFQKVVATDVCVSTEPSNFLTVFSCFVFTLPGQQDGIPCMGGILAMYSRTLHVHMVHCSHGIIGSIVC